MLETITIAKVANVLGLVGVALILLTYFLLQTNKMDAHKFNYSFFNLSGSALIVFSLFYNWNLPSFIVESVWSLISLYGLIKFFLVK